MKSINAASLIGLGTLALFSTASVAKEWAFDVYLDKSKIGQHVFTLENNSLTSKAKFNVKVLFIEAYQYEHKASEQWQGDCLSRLTSRTVENKVVFNVEGKLAESGFMVSDGKQSQKLPDCTMTFAYWNPKILSQTKLLNPQNAEWLDTTVSKIGVDSIEVKGKEIEAEHYHIDGSLDGKNKLKIDLWYGPGNAWLALRSTTPEGHIINYRLR